MPRPIDVYDDPNGHWNLITSGNDTEFEDQHFDRKEAGLPADDGHLSSSKLSEIIHHAKETISAFANSNQDGGLLVIGVSKTGSVKGLNHLTDTQRNNLMDPRTWLANHDSRVKLVDCVDDQGSATKACFIYVPYVPNAICETPDKDRRAWRRQGAQNILLTADQKDQLRRDKRIISFEQEPCCEFDMQDLDMALLAEFRKVFHTSVSYKYSDEELLYQAGAIVKDHGKLIFNNAGFLFFTSNPQRILAWAYVHLVRYETVLARSGELGLVSLDRSFTGPLPTQIRNVRAYFQESGFFKKYQVRNPAGGFTEQPEFPLVAVDEVIVNAIAHREYAVRLPTECKKFSDAFVVENAGRVLQRDREVPKDFSLEDVALEHAPRNPKILEWFKMMRDERGAEFVRALSEGTRRMRDEMLQMGLPAPRFHVSPSATTVTLYSNATEREALLKSTGSKSSEFANLFPIQVTRATNLSLSDYPQLRSEILGALGRSLEKNGWFIDRHSHGRVHAHKRGTGLPLPSSVTSVLRFYPAFSFQIREFWGLLYLTVDYELQVKNVLSVGDLLRLVPASKLIGSSAIANWNGWQRGKILSIFEGQCAIQFFDIGTTQETIPSEKVIPNLRTRVFDEILLKRGIAFDLGRAIKQSSLASQPNAARTRAARTETALADIAATVFPLALPTGPVVSLQPIPATLSRDLNVLSALNVISVSEPKVEFHHHQETADIRDGITRFGAYDNDAHDIELIPLCTGDSREQMATLIERLKVGKYKYKGAERTFSTRFSYASIITGPTDELLLNECSRVLTEHPSWAGDQNLRRLFLIHTPERGYSIDDENSPYYKLKRSLLEAGIPSQMVDTPTLANPDWKDLNLALNIIAKCGVVPWVLPDAVPDADFFVGLSYTQNRERGSNRTMGYANVFNSYGRWGFYSANTEVFPFEKKSEYFSELVKTTLRKLSLSETPSIYFHYSAKFSRDDKLAITNAARAVRPRGTYSFVWINTTHNVRFYDNRPDGDGSLSRGSFVVTSPRQLYLSTTGSNPFRKVLGTPQVLELNIFTEESNGQARKEYDLRALAYQILSLTKLNWASTDSLCAEPITTKYAGDIAYLTAAFMRQEVDFKLHPVLERTPWFI